MKGEHYCYIIKYADRECCWLETERHLSYTDDLDEFVRVAKRLVEQGHRDVRIIELVICEREVMTV